MFTALYKAETCCSTFTFCLNEKGSISRLLQTWARKELSVIPQETVGSAVSLCVWTHFGAFSAAQGEFLTKFAYTHEERAELNTSWGISLSLFLTRATGFNFSYAGVLLLRIQVQNNSETITFSSFLRMHVYQIMCHHPTRKNSQMWSLPLMKAWV